MSFLDFKAKNLPADLTSGAVSALVAIPHAIASALLAGVNPTYAFNALMTGTQMGSTMVAVLERYAGELRANGGRLMLSGVHEQVLAQLLRTETTEDIPEDAIFMATPVVGESTKAAVTTAKAWLAQQGATVSSAEAPAPTEQNDQSGNGGEEV